MAEQFYTIVTKIGKAKIANAAALGNKINITKFQVGDGNGAYYNPTEDQTTLRNKVWEGNISSIRIDEENPNWIVMETIIPGTDGGFMVREAAAVDSEGNLIAIGKYPETYKPVAGDGSIKDLIIKMVIEVSNASAVTLKIDPTVTLATKQDILVLENMIKNIKLEDTAISVKDTNEHFTGTKLNEVLDELYLKSKGNETSILNLQNADGNLANLQTTNKANLVGAINELFQNVDNGKTLIASAITDKGVATSKNDTFQVMATNIGKLNKKYNYYGARLYKNNSNPALVRTGDASNLVANAGIGTNVVQNDFDNIYPWSHRRRCNLSPTGVVNAYEGEPTFKLDGTNGEVMVETPKFYQRYIETTEYIEWQISELPLEGFRLSERFKTKTSTLDKIYTGAYEAGYVNSKLTSRTGVSPAVSMGRNIARDRAKAISTDWGIIDIAYRCDILFYLFVVEFATLNSQSIAAGLTTLSTLTNTGQADTVAATTGSKTNATDGKSAFKYRGEENPWGNIWEWVDGCNISNRKAYAHYIPQEYADDKFTTPYVATAYTNASASGFTKTMGNDNNVPYISLPTDSTGSDSTYYCDNYYQATGNIAPLVGGFWYDASGAGLVSWNCDNAFSSSGSSVGARLSYKPS